MEELIGITVTKDRETEMIKNVSRELNKAVSTISPPINDERDILRLKRYRRKRGHIELVYEVSRDARLSKKELNKSPYREIGFTMQVGRNS